jgi:UDP-N-acetylmuramate: L-alanyl-gamma-D-glutamyl-meso-diaminopimelate ligase
MKAGIHGNSLVASVENADSVHWYERTGEWSGLQSLDNPSSSSYFYTSVDKIVTDLSKRVSEGDIVVLMSNGDFDDAGASIINALEQGVSR